MDHQRSLARPLIPDPLLGHGAFVAHAMIAFLAIALLLYVVALAASNSQHVRVDWVFGTSSVSLVWLVAFAALLGWLLGILTAATFRWRTRAPRLRTGVGVGAAHHAEARPGNSQ